MQALEKILEEIDIKISGSMGRKREGLLEARDIIRNHMNDCWVSVEERVPKEEGYKVIVCRKQGSIDTGIYSPYAKQWFIGNISALGKDVIAWRPLPEPYHQERSDNNDGK